MARFNGTRVQSLNDLSACEWIVICLPNSSITATVLPALHLQDGAIVIDSTTGGAALASPGFHR